MKSEKQKVEGERFKIEEYKIKKIKKHQSRITNYDYKSKKGAKNE